MFPLMGLFEAANTSQADRIETILPYAVAHGLREQSCERTLGTTDRNELTGRLPRVRCLSSLLPCRKMNTRATGLRPSEAYHIATHG